MSITAPSQDLTTYYADVVRCSLSEADGRHVDETNVPSSTHATLAYFRRTSRRTEPCGHLGMMSPMHKVRGYWGGPPFMNGRDFGMNEVSAYASYLTPASRVSRLINTLLPRAWHTSLCLAKQGLDA